MRTEKSVASDSNHRSEPRGFLAKSGSRLSSGGLQKSEPGLKEQLLKLESFRTLTVGWDSYEAVPPSQTAIEHAREVLRFLSGQDGVPKVRLTPCVEGGVTILLGDAAIRYADIECFNDGEILAITSEPEQDPAIWPVDLGHGSLQAALDRIQTFLNA
jgi:hypothetical protein